MSDVEIYTGHDVRLQLTDALLMYRSGDVAVYATTHPIQIESDDPTRKVIGAGTPTTKESLADFANAVGAATSAAATICSPAPTAAANGPPRSTR